MNSLFPEKQPDPTRATLPNATEVVAPAFLANVPAGSVRLEWKSQTTARGGVQYHLQVATDPNFKWLIVNEHNVANNSYEFNKAEAGQRYFWRVASFKADSNPGYAKSNFVGSVFNVK